MRQRVRSYLAPLCLLTSLACSEPTEAPPTPSTPTLDDCEGLAPLTLTAQPSTLRVQGAASLHAAGGTGRYTFSVAPGGPGGEVRGERLIAGATPGRERVVVRDDCGGAAELELPVEASFEVAPVRATVRPGSSFALRVRGTLGAPSFRAQALGSGGSLSAEGLYTAGPSAGLDLLVVSDPGSGEEVLLQYRVDPRAQLRASPARLGVPAGASVTLTLREGSGEYVYRKEDGPGTLEGSVYRAEPGARGLARIEATDVFTGDTATLWVQVLEELTRPGRPHGRLTDLGNLATGDFDGDGLEDVALGVPESDLARPLGGAVFVFRGSAEGLPSEPTWVLTGDSDTASLGAVLAAGDLDGDGRDDLAVAEPGADVTVADSGAVLLYRFTSEGPARMRAPLTGIGRGSFGAALAIADLDGDGDQDLAIGSPGADLAPSSKVSARGVVDVFLLEPGTPIADLPALRLGGSDLAPDGSLKASSSLRFGRALAAADFNGDGRVDLASLGLVNAARAAGAPAAKSQIAVAVHLGRAASPALAASADLYVLPSEGIDTSEGTWRLAVAPPVAGAPAKLLLTADLLDVPDRSAEGGAKSRPNAGGALLFDLSDAPAPGLPPATPRQLGPRDAFARLWGDVAEGMAGRSVAVADVNGDGTLELVLGAPKAAGSAPLAGKLLVYPYGTLVRGARHDVPLDSRAGEHQADALGVAVAAFAPSPAVRGLVAFAARASTVHGDFTGRLDTYLGRGALASFARSEAALPARLGSQAHGSALALGVVGDQVRALVGMPGYAGPGAAGDGNELGAGQVLRYALGRGDAPSVLHEGADRPYLSGAQSAFGGRGLGGAVAMTDFDGDGLLDAVLAAPQLSTPTMATASQYARSEPTCITSTAQANGGALVYLARPDGSYREGFRLLGLAPIAGCTPVDAAACRRTGLGRFGLAGGFDLNGDGRGDVLLTRDKGLELFLGRAPDDATLAKPSMACDPVFSLPALAQPVSAPAALGDLDGDGCDEVALRYADATRSGLLVVFGFSSDGKRCRARTKAAWLRVSGDGEVGLTNMQLGIASARAGKLLGDARDFVAISAGLYPFEGERQPSVLLLESAALSALRPAQGEALVSVLDPTLAPLPLVYRERAVGFGRSLAGNVDLDGDAVVDLVVAAPGASLNGDGAGAVFAFRGGVGLAGRLDPYLTLVGDGSERASVGQALAVVGRTTRTEPTIAVGAPLSYRTGTANGTSWLMPLPRLP